MGWDRSYVGCDLCLCEESVPWVGRYSRQGIRILSIGVGQGRAGQDRLFTLFPLILGFIHLGVACCAGNIERRDIHIYACGRDFCFGYLLCRYRSEEVRR